MSKRPLLALLITLLLPLTALPVLADEAYEDEAAALYRTGRQALNESDFDDARRLFHAVSADYPESEVAGDAVYWEAFSRYRLGGKRNLERALTLLDRQREQYPDARTARRDAQSLSARVENALAELGSEEAARRSYERARDLEQATDPETDSDLDLKMAALQALMNMRTDRAMPILRKVLLDRSPETAELRAQAVFILSQQDTEEAAPLLLDAVRNDPDEEVRGQAVFWLSQLGGEESLDAIEEIMATSDDPVILEKAVFALSQIGGERAYKALKDLALDPAQPEELRANAIFWLGQTGEGASVTFLDELYRSVDSDELKDKVIFAISQLNTDDGGKWLVDLALNERESIDLRKNALFWAGQGNQLEIGHLIDFYWGVEDTEMRGQVIFVLSQRDDDKAIETLVDIAKRETDTELRTNAVFWLGQSDNPRAVDYLEELLSR